MALPDGRVAIFVDGENLSASCAEAILSIGAQVGVPDVVRVYMNAACNSDWHGAAGFRLIHAGTGKNAADLLLSIDAMELALTQAFSGVVIASSDGDFTHLAVRLRERGLRVVGVGEDKAPRAFRGACTRFEVVTARSPAKEVPPPVAPASPPAPDPAPAPTGKKSGVSVLDLNIREMIRQHSTKAQGMRITDLNPAMSRAHGTRISEQPERTWRAYLAARPALYDLDAKGPEARVRFRPAGFA